MRVLARCRSHNTGRSVRFALVMALEVYDRLNAFEGKVSGGFPILCRSMVLDEAGACPYAGKSWYPMAHAGRHVLLE